MHIIWHGQSCFQIIVPKTKNGQVAIVIDPFSKDIGLRLPKLEADVLLVTHDHSDHNNAKEVLGVGGKEPFLITGPGEYEIKEIYIQGISAFHDNFQGKDRGKSTIYIVEAEEIKICHLGDIGQKELTPEQLEKIGGVDVLLIPVGGVYTVSAKEASEIINQIEPRIVIPMHYHVPKLKIKLEGVDKFLKIMGVKSIIPQNKLLIKKKDLPAEDMQVVVLKP